MSGSVTLTEMEAAARVCAADERNIEMSNQVQKIESKDVETVTNGSDAMTAIFERAAFDQNFPLDRLEKMMEMQERWEARQAEKEYSEALAAAKEEMPQVLKNRRNNQTNSNYADLEAIDKAISPVISKHGFALSFFPAKSDLPDHYGITCEVRHKAGHTVTHDADIPADEMGIKGTVNKTKTHAFGSTMAYGRRYMKTMIFDVATADDDGNEAGGDGPITEEQCTKVLGLIEETETDTAKFCQVMKIDSVAEMPMSKLGKAEALLIAKKAKVAKS